MIALSISVLSAILVGYPIVSGMERKLNSEKLEAWEYFAGIFSGIIITVVFYLFMILTILFLGYLINQQESFFSNFFIQLLSVNKVTLVVPLLLGVLVQSNLAYLFMGLVGYSTMVVFYRCSVGASVRKSCFIPCYLVLAISMLTAMIDRYISIG